MFRHTTDIFWCINILDVTACYGRSFDFKAFFRYFYTKLTSIHVCSILSSPNFNRLCGQLIYTFFYVKMPIVTAGYGRLSDSIEFFFLEDFSYIIACLKRYIASSNYYKLCIKAEVNLSFSWNYRYATSLTTII